MESPSLEVFKRCVDVALGVIVNTAAGVKVGLDVLIGLFQPQQFHDSMKTEGCLNQQFKKR